MNQNKTILIIEADAHLRMVLTLAMKEEGYTVIEAENEKEAINVILGLSELSPISGLVYGTPRDHEADYTAIILEKLCMTKFGKKPVVVSSVINKHSTKLPSLKSIQSEIRKSV